jgi:hypothetical protein
MFDRSSLPEPGVLAEVEDATLVGAITGWLQTSAGAEARAFAAMAELARRRCAEEDERNYWPADPWDCAGAEVAAAMNCGMGKAAAGWRQRSCCTTGYRRPMPCSLRGRLPRRW